MYNFAVDTSDTVAALIFIGGFLLSFACFITIIDYWCDVKPRIDELWARRVLGDDVYERNSRHTVVDEGISDDVEIEESLPWEGIA